MLRKKVFSPVIALSMLASISNAVPALATESRVPSTVETPGENLDALSTSTALPGTGLGVPSETSTIVAEQAATQETSTTSGNHGGSGDSVSDDSSTVGDTNETVEVRVSSVEKVDIVLAKGSGLPSDVSNNIGSFKAQLENALQQRGVNTRLANIQEVETSQVDMTSAFSWQDNAVRHPVRTNWPNSTAYGLRNWQGGLFGRYEFTNNGRDLLMNGNPSRAGHGVSWITSADIKSTQEFSFDYSLDFGDNFNGAGMLLNVKQNGSHLSGQMIWLGKANNSGIYNFNVDTRNTSSNINRSLVSSARIPFSGRMTVKSGPDNITILVNGAQYASYDLPTRRETSGFGFFGDLYSHGCDMLGRFTAGNLNMMVTNEKSFLDVINSPEWQEKSTRVLVNVENKNLTEFTNPATVEPIANRMMNENIHYVGWGYGSAVNPMNQLLNRIDSKGAVKTDSFANNINETADYIKDLIGTRTIKNTEVLVNDREINLEVEPASLRTNTADDKFPQGKWQFEYTPTFDSSPQNVPGAGQWFSDLPDPSSFVNPGQYTLKFAGQPVKQFTVHTRPQAGFSAQINNDGGTKTITITDKSYDPDATSQADKGIVEKEWSYRSDGNEFTVVQSIADLPQTLDKAYQIRLRVKDAHDAWSSYSTKLLAPNIVEPIADFTLSKDRMYTFETQTVENTSYTANGTPIANNKWELYKNGQKFRTYTTETPPEINFRDPAFGAGTYALELTASAGGQTSLPFTRTFTVKVDDQAPLVNYSKVSTTTETLSQGAINVTPEAFSENNPQGGITVKATSTVTVSNGQNLLDETLWGTGANVGSDGTLNIKPTFIGTKFLPLTFVDADGNETNVNVEVEVTDDTNPVATADE